MNSGNKASSDVLPAQIAPLDHETLETVYLINSYSLPADFFQWLSGGTFTQEIIQEKIADGKYTRMVQYSIDKVSLFTGRFELELSKFSKDAVKFLTSGKTPMASSFPKFSEVQKEPISKTHTDLHYTIISTVYNQNQCAGFCWEIFELPLITAFYSKMDDPLRHWRRDY